MYRALIVLALVSALAAEEPCTCDQVTDDIGDLRRFLANPGRYSLNSILPGELSPYVCNCNKYRQRRSEIVLSRDLAKVHPKVAAGTVPFLSSPRHKDCSKSKQQHGRYRCATGYMRKGFFCIKDPCYDGPEQQAQEQKSDVK